MGIKIISTTGSSGGTRGEHILARFLLVFMLPSSNFSVPGANSLSDFIRDQISQRSTMILEGKEREPNMRPIGRTENMPPSRSSVAG